MKLISFLSILGILTLIFAACQKEISNDNLNPTPPAGILGDSNYLDKIYFIDSIGGVVDTTEIVSYYYDNLKRVIKLEDSIITQESMTKTLFEYLGNDTLPFKYKIQNFEAAPNTSPYNLETVTTFNQYNAASKNIYDSNLVFHVKSISPLEYDNYTIVNKYTYNGLNIYGESVIKKLLPPAIFLGKDTAQIDARGNIISHRRYQIENGVSILNLTSTLSYDDKPSPFKRLSNFRSLLVFPFGETLFEELQSNNNRLRTYEVLNNGAINETDFTGKYTYNSYGYPVLIKEEYAPGQFTLTCFKYINL